MSVVGKNRKLFSYNNKDKSNLHFDKKDFDKTNSYNSSFNRCSFNGTSLRGAKLKFCSFKHAIFEKTEFVGTNLRGSNFEGATFNRAIFNGVNLENANFMNATFKDVIFINTNIRKAKNFPIDKNNIIVYNSMPPNDNYSEKLINIVDKLRENEFINKSHTLHLKGNKLNTIYIDLLVNEFSEEKLIQYLPQLSHLIIKPFFTLSYIENILTKLCNDDTI